MRLPPLSVAPVTGALFAIGMLPILHEPLWLFIAMASIAPLLILWVAIDVLMHRGPTGRPLGDAEFGYVDRPDLRPVHRGRPCSDRASE